MRVRNLVAVGAAFCLVVELTVAVVVTAGPAKPAVPQQQIWTVANKSHHVSAAVTQARIVDGRLVHTAAAARLPGPVVRAATSSRGVPPATHPRTVRLPVAGKVTEKVRVLPAPRPAAKTGYNPKTSKELAPHSASQDAYANADGTRSAFDFALPVNYKRPDGSWAPINTALVSEGPVLQVTGGGSPAAVSPTISASPSVSPAPSVVPSAGWTERSEAEPETFAPYANAPDLVTMPLGGGQTVAFGVASAGGVAGAAQGSSVAYAGLRPDSTVRFTAGTGMVKEQIVLDSPAAPTSWVFPLDLTGLRAQLGPGGLVEFANAAGKVVGYVPHGFMSDSNIDPHSGDGATSWGVTYSLTTAGGRQAIRMTLDASWLNSKARVFPVTVDPSITDKNSDGTTYVQYPDTNDFSTDPELHVGTYDGGTHKAESYLAFTNVASSLQNDTVLGVELGVYNTWSYSCSPRSVYVYPVTSSWSITGNKTWPGPSTGASIGRSSFANGWVPLGSTVSPCPASWHGIKLDQAGTSLVNGWTHGTVADNGLALGASNSDSYAWKKFSSYASGTGNPYLDVNYTTDGASYRLASRTPIKQVLPTQNGAFKIQVTNTGSSTWTSTNGYELSYRAYDSAGKIAADHPVFTAIPSGQTVAPGQTITLDAVVDALPNYAAYAIDFDMYSAANTSSPLSFKSQGIQPFAIGLDILSSPTVLAVYPPNGYVSPTLRQQLSVVASTASGTITYSFTMTCAPLTGQTCSNTSPVTSGSISKPYWTPPIASMQWNTSYTWSVTTTANGAPNTISGLSYEAKVAQPGITAGLGATSGQAYDPLSGNYTTSATDAAVKTAGMPLEIARTYNSLDPRTSNAFGAGWSSVIDMSLRADNDATGNGTDSTGDVVVTLSDGKQVRFGENGNGTYAGPFGGLDTLKHNSGGTWTLRDSSDDQYTFTSAGQISKITDPNGRSLLFTGNSSGQVATITDGVSQRTLTLIWAKGTGATYAHVSSVTTQAPITGQSGYAWNYAYSGDELSSVCDPTETCSSCPAGCTAYSYQTGSHYLSGVLDSGPRAYWQLGEGSGATTAADEVDANLGTANGTYSGTAPGAAGALAGSSETSAAFNGTSSSVSLPGNLMTDSTDTAVELWFKAPSGSSGVLFSYAAHPVSDPVGNHEPALYIGTNGELYGEFWTGSVQPIHTTTSVTDGNWHYVVLTASSTSQSMYLDGKQAGVTLTGAIDQTNESVDTIGAGLWSGWTSVSTAAVGYFTGDIAQVAVYAHPLPVPDIATHYALGLAALPELTQVTLPSGNVYEQATYDPATDRLASYTDPDGGTWAIGQPLSTGSRPTPDSLGEVVDHVTVTDPAARHDIYSYDMLDGGRLLTFSNGIDSPEAYGYDKAGFLTTVVNQDGNLVCFTNDIHGHVLTRTWYPNEPAALPGGGIGTIPDCATSSGPNCTSTFAPCTTFYGYAPYSTSNPLDPTNGELTSVRDGRSASITDNTYLTSYAYNAVGQLTTQTTPPTSDFPNGRVTSDVYSVGTETAYGGSGTVPAGLLLSKSTPGGAKTSYQYYSDGDLAQVTEPSGRYTVYTYDLLGRVTKSVVYTTSFPSGETTGYTYDGLNRQAGVTHPGVANTLTGVTHTLQDAYSYDADGDLTSLTESDPTGNDPSRTTSYTYNDHDQMATRTQPAGATPAGTSQPGGASSADPQGATTGYDYDAFGNVTIRTDPNGDEYRYTYNEYNEPTQVTLYTPSASLSTPTANCSAPAVQDPDGGCDLVLDSYGYKQSGLLASTTDALGRITSDIYDSNQDLLTVQTTDPSTSPTTGRLTTYSYDGAGNRISQSVSALSGGAAGTTTVTDDTFDAANRLTSVVADAGTGSADLNRTVAYTYDADNHVLSQSTGGAGQGGQSVTDYTYDTVGDRTGQTVQDGSTSLTTTWTYDQNGQPLSMTAPAGNASGATAANFTASYGYDPAGNLVTQTGPPVQTESYAAQSPVSSRPVTTYGYDTFADRTQVNNPDNQVTVTGYDGDGRVTSVTQPSYTPPGGTASVTKPTSYAYDENGNLAQVTDPKNNVTQYGYDPQGDVTSVTEPQLPGQSAPGVWHYTYDGAGEQLSAADPLGNTTQATYDYFGNQATSTDALTNTTKYAYDYLGDQTQVTTPDGAVTTNTYDDLGELTSTADAYGDTSSYQYDYAGRPQYAYNPDGSFAQYGHDEAGNLTSVADWGVAPPLHASPELRSESFGYDLNGDVTSAKDWNGNTTTYAYNAAGERTGQVKPVSASASITTSYGYDAAGNQTAVTGGNGNATWTTYNAWNLPESVVKPATATATTAANTTWTTGYDEVGRPVSVSQPGGITQSYGYDPLGDLTSESGSGGSAATASQTLAYDLDGRLISATAPSGTDSFGYDGNGELKSAAGPSGTSGFTYNNDGLVASESAPGGTTSYTYDSADRLATLADPLTASTLTYGYNADSQPTSIGYSVGGASGPSQAFTYNSLNRLASNTVTAAAGGGSASESYGYDSNGNLTSQSTSGLAGPGTTTYAYDEANRLASAVSGGVTTAYAYDGDGNLTKAGATTYAYNPQDQVTSSVTSAGTTSYGYALAGALASVTAPGAGAQAYTSDAFGNLVGAPGGISYGYDALGRLVARGTGTGTVSLSYLGTSTTVASDGSDSYSYGPSGSLVAAGAAGGTGYATLSDLHGDVTGVFSASGSASSLAGSAAYGPYGAVTATSGAMPGLGYQGAYTDPSTGLVDMGARWYDPATGSFTANDTIAGSPLPATVDGNPYAYTTGDPLTETDPSGHFDPGGFNPVQVAEDVGMGAVSWWASVAGLTAGLTAGFTAAMWAFPDSTASGCQDVVCGSPESGSNYALGSLQIVAGPTLATVPEPAGRGVRPVVHAVPLPPPPPPPPPQDCYAGPHPTCTPAPPPASLAHQEWITRTAHDSTSVSGLFRARRGITEHAPARQGPVKGTGAARVSSDPSTDESGDDISGVTAPLNGIGVPATPQAPGPNGGGNVTETATGGGSNIHGGGGGLPPTSNGACEPAENGNSGSQLTSDELRTEARDKWQAATGRRAIWDGLQIHHLVPLEWRGVYSGDINGLDNLAGMSPGDHSGITEAWRNWKGGLAGRTPTEQELLQQRDNLNEIYGPLMTPPC